MGLERIFLDTADRKARDFWTLPAVGFNVVQEADWQRLLKQYRLFKNGYVEARCTKLTPSHNALAEQASCPLATCAPYIATTKSCNEALTECLP